MKSLAIALTLILTVTTENQSQLSNEERNNVMETFFKPLKLIFYELTDQVFDKLVVYFMSLEAEPVLNIPRIRKRCIDLAHNFIYSEKGMNNVIIKFLRTMKLELFNENELGRIVDLIETISSMQAKVLCLSLH